jgi:hypothetical protein
MFDVNRDPRSEEMYRLLCRRGYDAIISYDDELAGDEIRLESLPVITDGIATEMTIAAAADTEVFLTEALGLSPAPGSRFVIRAEINDNAGSDRRAHMIEIGESGVIIGGASEWGVAAGFYHLQRLLKLRGAPILKKSIIYSSPRLDPALAYPAFKRDTTTDFDFPEAYDENYLRSIARAGYTGIHLNFSSSMFSRSVAYSELDNPQAAENFATLNRIIAIARRCALEVYLSYYSVPLPSGHPLFSRIPAMRGSRIVNTDSLHPLCWSSPDTRKYYREHFADLFRRVEGLAGVLLIVGCEGMLHCHTASELDSGQRVTCPACAEAEPEKIVAKMMNEIAGAIKASSLSARCIVWTYGIHTWSADRGERMIELLSPDCELMTNFDTGDDFILEGANGHVFDYSLRCVGPGEMFRRHAECAKKRGVRLHAKCESGHPLEFYNFPTLPAHTRWGGKYDNIVQSSAEGALFNWKFAGFTDQIPEELAGLMSWRGCESSESLLRRIAAREFGTEAAEAAMSAWCKFDQAMEYHPFSGETAGYFKGPFYIAFAHPLILEPCKLEGLTPDFWTNFDAGHLIGAHGRPRFVTDLSWTQPFGVEAILSALGKMEKLWREGCGLMPDTPRLAKHRALARGFLCMLRTAANLVKFFDVRDNMYRQASTLESYRRNIEKLRAIAIEELENSQAGLECLQKNPALGFQYTYRAAFTRSMCETKISHTRNLIERGLPQLWYNRRFSLGKTAEWLHTDGRQ